MTLLNFWRDGAGPCTPALSRNLHRVNAIWIRNLRISTPGSVGVLNFISIFLSQDTDGPQGMSLFSVDTSAPANPRGPPNPEIPAASQLFIKVRSPFLSLPRFTWKKDSKSKYASSRRLRRGEDPGACWGGSASQVLMSLLSSLE